jgi:hypothetical protein
VRPTLSAHGCETQIVDHRNTGHDHVHDYVNVHVDVHVLVDVVVISFFPVLPAGSKLRPNLRR